MSFSSLVKAELAKTSVEGNCDVIAEIAGFVPMCGSLKFTGAGMILGFNTESAPVARRLFTFLKRYYSDEVNVKFSKSKQLKKNNIYSVVLENESETKMLLDDIDYLRGANVFMPNYAPHRILKDDCCKRAYIRGSFLGAGSISNPKKYYHLEFVCNNEAHSKFLSEIINGFGFKSK
ncbi:MAG: DNA-binding protein WhiA, partial [Peptoniphilus sp.]|nr:DNA-binding protein WhiA [Peptoniphilus sp.]